MKLLGHTKPILGVIHLAPLPGAPRYQGSLGSVIERALADARTYLRAGMTGLIVENYGDLPFHAEAVPAETTAALTAAACEIRRLGSFPMGINVLRSDGEAALAVAIAADAQFIRVNVLAGTMLTDQGLVTGRAAQLLRRRAELRARVAIWADLLVKHARPLTPLDPAETARDLRERALADALIVTGERTGAPADTQLLGQLRRAVPRAPWVVGSGITAENIADYRRLADGFIVGTALKRGGQTTQAVSAARARKLVAASQAAAGGKRA